MPTNRDCGECSECCRILQIEQLDKPPRSWCQHANAACGGTGCAIYADRPKVCSDYACVWKDPGPLEELFPAVARPDRIGMLVQTVRVGEDEFAIEAIVAGDEPTPAQRELLEGIVKAADVVSLITGQTNRMLTSPGGMARLLRLHAAARAAAAAGGTP